jgi:tetratricopeptide (TPR) repeat protein
MGQEDAALADYEQAIQLDPGYAWAYRLRGAILSRRGLNERALADYDSVVRLDPADAGGLKDRGGVLVRLGQYERAIDELNRAVDLAPNLASAYLNRGAAYNSLGQYERAIDDLGKAIGLDPRNAGAHTNIGLAYCMIGQYERAIEDLTEAVQLAPENAIVHLNRGNVYARLGLDEQASADYDRASQLNPALIAGYGGSARLLEEMGRHQLAIRGQRLSPRVDPKELDVWLERGNALRAQGDWSGAIGEYSRVIEGAPDRADAYVARGWARLCSGEPGAETDARAYLNLKGWRERLSPYMALLGFLGAQRAGKQGEAESFLEQAIAQTPQGTWPLPLLHYFQHDMPTKALLNTPTNETQETEAHTFVALEMLHRGDREQAHEHLRWVRDHGTSRTIAADVARATLKRLHVPERSLSRTVESMVR